MRKAGLVYRQVKERMGKQIFRLLWNFVMHNTVNFCNFKVNILLYGCK